jgi:hypothetical protein
VRADCVADRDVDSVARDVRMVSVQAVHNGEQVCRAVGAPRDESPCLAAWMDKCGTEDGAVPSSTVVRNVQAVIGVSSGEMTQSQDGVKLQLSSEECPCTRLNVCRMNSRTAGPL